MMTTTTFQMIKIWINDCPSIGLLCCLVLARGDQIVSREPNIVVYASECDHKRCIEFLPYILVLVRMCISKSGAHCSK
jgi:hypothetical protein